MHQPGANHAPGASVTQVNHSVHTPSTVLRIRADPSMQIFWVSVHLHWDLPLPLVIAEHDFSVFLSCSLSGASSVSAIIIIIIIINKNLSYKSMFPATPSQPMSRLKKDSQSTVGRKRDNKTTINLLWQLATGEQDPL